MREIIQRRQRRTPFLAENYWHNGCKLHLGLGSADGCVQFSSSGGSPPYLMTLGKDAEVEGEQDFRIGDTASPVSRRFCLPMQKVADIAAVFLES